MNIRYKIENEIMCRYKHIKRDMRLSISNHLSRNIIQRESIGEVISLEHLQCELIPVFIKSYIRHNETVYDFLLRRGVDRDDARYQIRKYVKEKYKWVTRK